MLRGHVSTDSTGFSLTGTGEVAAELITEERIDDRSEVILPRPPELVEVYMNPAQKWMVQCSLCDKWRFASKLVHDGKGSDGV